MSMDGDGMVQFHDILINRCMPDNKAIPGRDTVERTVSNCFPKKTAACTISRSLNREGAAHTLNQTLDLQNVSH